MSASHARQPTADPFLDVHDKFLSILPGIEAYARSCFRTRPRTYREDFVAETVAYCWRWFRKLIERGKDPTQFPATFVRYAVLAVKNGRSISRPMNRKELYSAAARCGDPSVQSLEARCPRENAAWRDILIEKKAFPPDEVGSMRVDFARWREGLPARGRQIVDLLASGEQASAVAQALKISRTRVTQLRQELAASWREFQGEIAEDGERRPAAALIPTRAR